MKKNVLITFIIIIIVLLIILSGILIYNNTYKEVELNSNSSTSQNSQTIKDEKKQDQTKSKIVPSFDIKQKNLDDDQYYLFEDYSNSNEILESSKTIDINDIVVKLEDKKVKVFAQDMEYEVFDDVNYIMADINEISDEDKYLYVFAIKKDGTVSKLEIAFKDIECDILDSYEDNYAKFTADKLDFDNASTDDNYHDLKYIIGYKQDRIIDRFNNARNIFMFLDIEGKYYLDR